MTALEKAMDISHTGLTLSSLLMSCDFLAILPRTKISNQAEVIIITVNMVKVENTVNSC